MITAVASAAQSAAKTVSIPVTIATEEKDEAASAASSPTAICAW
jgi:hypothetical protein